MMATSILLEDIVRVFALNEVVMAGLDPAIHA
jgi:hypothetical protein